MGTAYSVDVSGQQTEVEVFPQRPYTSPGFSLRGSFGTILIFAADEQLAEIESALKTYLDGKRYPETSDQQPAINHELNQSIEEEIA